MLVTLVCHWCGKNFQRYKGNADYRAKHGMRTFCSLQCSGLATTKRYKPPKGQIQPHLADINSPDVYSPFRNFMRHIKRSKKGYNVTINDLKAQWDKQQGICPFTGWKLENPWRSRKEGTIYLPFHTRRASLDRIDCKKGYMTDNIQFVSLMAQYAKNRFTDQDVIDFCKTVVEYKKINRPFRAG